MRFIRTGLACSLLTLAGISPVAAQTPEDLAILKKVTAAAVAAPASRVTSTVTDRDSGALVETMVLERMPPDTVRIVTTHNGRPGSEMISDGKRSLRRTGPDEPWKPLPMNLSEMMNESRKDLNADRLREEHGHLKLIGNDQIDGTAASLYELTEDSGSSRIWIAVETSRLLKVERDYDGNVTVPEMKKSAAGGLDLKALQAQLKAAKVQHHLHSVSTYVYDPSIKITMPPG